ncbi:putative DNA modification/repair radical SAM protein [Roseisolibacter agri]|uniref:DNA modification/repair radical SAM protein n=1 Tax=Roseisolibacter agri TaxID=2014610 RepID=A0AA37Q0E0_9BACT|nr:putative DNA modification/repair radical SAM protein [Roseisolibacter agri]GLC24335.1 putative DNA modification/repair radical SAM protein [Roseisolibacter agri]
MDSRKLAVLADAARLDAPCGGRGARGGTATSLLPSDVEPGAIYESVAADGRKVPLLRILLSNHCVHDCAYCPLRRSADPPRARLSVRDVVRLTIEWHRRGLVEGLFLSSAVDRDADHTMEQMVAVARTLRREHHFLGYVHLKVLPDASPDLIREAGRWADRVSVNVELPTQRRLDALAPGRRLATIHRAMDRLRDGIAEAHEVSRRHRVTLDPARAWRRALPRFAPAGQVTQLIVGADDATDAELLGAASVLYQRQRLRRVYYGAFVPLADARGDLLPDVAPPAMRERRLYQADWLVREYGFAVHELAPADAPDLPLAIDPKLAWAMRHPEAFPVDVNRAPREQLLRVPGFGRRTVDRILAMRAWHRVRTLDLVRLHVPVSRALPFIVAADHGARAIDDAARVLQARIARLTAAPRQLDLFAA